MTIGGEARTEEINAVLKETKDNRDGMMESYTGTEEKKGTETEAFKAFIIKQTVYTPT